MQQLTAEAQQHILGRPALVCLAALAGLGLCWPPGSLLALWLMWRKRSHQAQSSGQEEKEEEDETQEYDLEWLVDEHMQWPVENVQTGCEGTTALMGNFTTVVRCVLRRTFFLVLQGAIGFYNAFEGWNALEEEMVYHVLIPLTPP